MEEHCNDMVRGRDVEDRMGRWPHWPGHMLEGERTKAHRTHNFVPPLAVGIVGCAVADCRTGSRKRPIVSETSAMSQHRQDNGR
jgi:hypothetical protein